MSFRLCPICELNYITDDNEKMCDVCRSARNGSKKADEILCPVCHINTVNANEDMCAQCRREAAYDEAADGRYRRTIIEDVDEVDDVEIDDDMEMPEVGERDDIEDEPSETEDSEE